MQGSFLLAHLRQEGAEGIEAAREVIVGEPRGGLAIRDAGELLEQYSDDDLHEHDRDDDHEAVTVVSLKCNGFVLICNGYVTDR
jgi:hypothetical protein